jgi:hypothetical protein
VNVSTSIGHVPTVLYNVRACRSRRKARAGVKRVGATDKAAAGAWAGAEAGIGDGAGASGGQRAVAGPGEVAEAGRTRKSR